MLPEPNARVEYVTFRELISREERISERFEKALLDHEARMKEHMETALRNFGHEVAEKLREQSEAEKKLEILNDDGSVKEQVRAALTGRYGAGAWAVAGGFVLLSVVLVVSNPTLRHFLMPFLPF